MSTDVVLENLEAGIWQIRIERPERMNALGVQTVSDLLRAVEGVRARAARVLLIRGSGLVFCRSRPERAQGHGLTCAYGAQRRH